MKHEHPPLESSSSLSLHLILAFTRRCLQYVIHFETLLQLHIQDVKGTIEKNVRYPSLVYSILDSSFAWKTAKYNWVERDRIWNVRREETCSSSRLNLTYFIPEARGRRDSWWSPGCDDEDTLFEEQNSHKWRKNQGGKRNEYHY